MRSRIIIALTAVAIFSAGAAIGATVPASAKTSIVTSQRATVPVFYKWRFATPTVRPSLVAWGMGLDLFVKGLRWDHWTLTGAYGWGTRWANTCNPTCSAGNYTQSPRVDHVLALALAQWA
jgi:hypothetical protein